MAILPPGPKVKCVVCWWCVFFNMFGLFGRCGKVCVDHLLLFWEGSLDVEVGVAWVNGWVLAHVVLNFSAITAAPNRHAASPWSNSGRYSQIFSQHHFFGGNKWYKVVPHT
jgi:hypothetical protein